MAAQLQYDINQAEAYEGGIYAQFQHDIMSFSAEPVTGIPFGRAVSRGTAENQVVLGGADLSAFQGFSVRELTREGDGVLNAIQYDQNETVAVMRDGYFWATCTNASIAGQELYFDSTTGELSSGSGDVQVTGARWALNRGVGELGLVHVQLTIANS